VRWDADAARDRVRDYLVEQLSSPDAVLIADEMDFLKKGYIRPGVKRQYTGTAGSIESSAGHPARTVEKTPGGQLRLSVPELRHLLTHLL
jgi:hypothetical protein